MRKQSYLILSLSPAPPGRPGTPEATGTDKSSVALKWAAPESDGGSPILNYIVEYRPEGSSQWKRANESTTVPDTTYSVTGLKKDRQYEFRVTAENKAGPGEPSKPSEPIKVVEPVREWEYHVRCVILIMLICLTVKSSSIILNYTVCCTNRSHHNAYKNCILKFKD